MAYFASTVSHASTGVKTVAVGFQPTGLRMVVSQKSDVTQNFAHLSYGVTDGTNQIYHSVFQDTTGGKSLNGTDHLVRHLERVSGTIVDKVVIDFDSFTATEFKYNVTTADVNYAVTVEAWS